MDKLSALLTKEYLLKLDNIDLAFKHRMKQGYAGARKASGKGNSLEFSDFKSYTSGDDIRRIDWNSYARFDKLFVKTFTQERQATANIFIDTSKSMDYGNTNKGLYAKLLAASISYIFLKNTDRVNIFTCGEKLIAARQGLTSRARFYQLVEFLDSLAFAGETNLSASLEATKNMKLSSGICYVLSDFFSADGMQEGLKALQYKDQNVMCVQLLSQSEINPAVDIAAQTGDVRLVDSETGQSIDVSMTNELLHRYNERLSEYRKSIKKFCDSRGFGYAFVNTQANCLGLINQLF